MSQRIPPSPKPKFDKVDLMIVCSMAVIGASYALGYQLDWGVTSNESVAEAPVMPEAATPPAPAAIVDKMLAAGKPTMPAATISPTEKPIVPTWSPDAREQSWEAMIRELEQVSAKHPGRVAIYFKDLKTNRSWEYHPDDLFPSASLIKVPIMAAVFMRIKEGNLSLNDKLSLHRRNRVGGSGSLKWRPDGTRLSVRDLLQVMISESDNTATAMLLETVGLGYVQRQFPQLGLLYTGIFEDGMSIRSGRVAHENYTTAREMTMLLEKIYRGELVDKPSSELMLEILKHRKAVASRLAKNLPRDWEIAHKTGLLRQACHDSAIVFSPSGDFALTVLTGQNPTYKRAKDFISRLGRIAYRHYGATPKGRRHVAAR